MLLKISHRTTYRYAAPVPYALQQLRLRPKSRHGQTVHSWQVEVEGGQIETSFEDEHANAVDLLSFTPGSTEISVRSFGEIEAKDKHGVIGKHASHVPLWLFKRDTALTRPGANIAALLAEFANEDEDLPRLHALSAHVLDQLPYSTEQTDARLTAEDVFDAGHAVCQDHAHVFIAAARKLGYPARYVSGYLMLQQTVDQTASHAWAEVHINALGWVGFDISNGISPDTRYVRVATGLDYLNAAPIRGMRFGSSDETLDVSIQVQQ